MLQIRCSCSCSMDRQLEHTASTWSMNIGTAWTCSTDKQHEGRDMEHGHEGMDMEHGHAAWGILAWEWRAKWTCSMSSTSFNPKPCGYMKLSCSAAWSHIWLLWRPIGEREALRHALAVVSSSGPTVHLERARDRVGCSRTAWWADFWQGECPALGWWWRGHIYLHSRTK